MYLIINLEKKFSWILTFKNKWPTKNKTIVKKTKILLIKTTKQLALTFLKIKKLIKNSQNKINFWLKIQSLNYIILLSWKIVAINIIVDKLKKFKILSFYNLIFQSTILHNVKLNKVINYNKQHDKNLQKNYKLKFKMLKFLKLYKIKKYKTSLFKTIYIKKKTNWFKTIETVTIKDKIIQILFSLILKACLKLFKNSNLFYLKQKCQHLINNTNKFKIIFQKIKIFENKYFIYRKKVNTKYNFSLALIQGIFKKCFYNIDQKWLIANLPFPKNFEYIFIKYIQNKKIYFINNPVKNTLKIEILLILILNWLTKSFKNVLKKFIEKYNKKKLKYFKHKILIKRNKSNVLFKDIVWFNTYFNYFVFYIKVKQNKCELLLKKLKKFFNNRGLIISIKQIKMFRQKFESLFFFFFQQKFYLKNYYIFYLLSNIQKNKMKKYINFKLLLKKYRKFIKIITNSSKINNLIQEIFFKLNIIFFYKQNNYFLVKKAYILKKNLNYYIIKKLKIYIFKKYKKNNYKIKT